METWAIIFGIVGALTGIGGLARAFMTDRSAHREKMAAAVLDGFTDLATAQKEELESIRNRHSEDRERWEEQLRTSEKDCIERLDAFEHKIAKLRRELDEARA